MKNEQIPGSPPPQRYAFAGFVLDRSGRRVLRGDGQPLTLTPRLFNALLLFVESDGELLGKGALMDALWPGLVVEENNLNQVVHGLRQALGDDGRRYIETVPRRGFRFVPAVSALVEGETSVVTDAWRRPAVVAPGSLPAGLKSRRPAWGRRQLILAATAVSAAALIAGWRLRPGSSALSAHDVTVGVLPFKALTSGPGDIPLSMGMADSLIERLSLVPGLVVRAVGSALQYAEGVPDTLPVAHELGATWIVDGSLLRKGDRVRATARLVRASDGTAIWNGNFDEKLGDLFSIQQTIAARVAGELRPKPYGEPAPERGSLAELGGTRNIDAYELYIAARLRSVAGFPDGTDTAIGMLHRALEIDPAFAVAWTQLASSHVFPLWLDAEPSDVFGLATPAMDRALMIAPHLARAHALLGYKRHLHDFDWEGSEREYRVALANNRNEVRAHSGLCMLLASTQDRIDEGLKHLHTARELHPMSAFLATLDANYLVARGHLERARVQLNRIMSWFPKYWPAHLALAQLQFAERHEELGIASLQHAVVISAGSTRAKAMLGVQLARLGRRDDARMILQDLLALARTRFVPPTSIGAVQAALGETGTALSSLELAVAVRDFRVACIKDDPHWAPLRQEPRFLALMDRLNLDRYGRGLPLL